MKTVMMTTDGRRLHFLATTARDLPHLGAHIVVEGLGPLRPGLYRSPRLSPRLMLLTLPFSPVSTAIATILTLPSKTLAGAEGFEPPSSVLETDSLTVELTPL